MQARLASNSQTCCLSPLSVGIISSLGHHAPSFMQYFLQEFPQCDSRIQLDLYSQLGSYFCFVLTYFGTWFCFGFEIESHIAQNGLELYDWG